MKQKFIASGDGMVSMLEFCYKNGLSRDNSILEHDGDKWSVRYVIDSDTGEYVNPEKWEE